MKKVYKFETEFINQPERRTIIETFENGWKILTYLPKGDLNRISKSFIEQYYPEKESAVLIEKS